MAKTVRPTIIDLGTVLDEVREWRRGCRRMDGPGEDRGSG